MTISSRVQLTFFTPTSLPTTSTASKTLNVIRLPLTVAPQYETRCETTGEIVPTNYKPLFRSNLWTTDEHERFLRGLELYPKGPWKEVANFVGTKTARQTMTHAQKYRQKIERRLRAEGDKRKSRRGRSSSKPTPKTPSLPFRDVLYGSLRGANPTSSAMQDIDFQPSSSSFDESWAAPFDTSVLDDEFQALIGSFQPLPVPEEVPFGEVMEWQL